MPNVRYLLLGVLFFSAVGAYSQTDVVGCVSGVVDTNAEDGILVSSQCGQLNSTVGTVSGNIEVKNNGDLTINSDINVLTGNIDVDPGSILRINGDILAMNGVITNHGTVIITGDIIAEGKLEVKGSGSILLDGGSFTSTGDGVVIKNGASVEMQNGSTINASTGVENSGTIISDGTGNVIEGGIDGNGTIDPKLGDCTGDCNDGPAVSITLDLTNANVCSGDVSTNLTYSATIGNPDEYDIDFDATAEVQGFTDVLSATLGASPITIIVPAGANPGVYNGSLTVHDLALNETSNPVAITITIIALPTVNIVADNTSLCYNATSVNFELTATVTGGSANYNYNWTELTGPHVSITSPINVSNSASAVNIQNYNVVSDGNPLSPENYTLQLQVTDGNGCTAISTTTFTVKTLPQPLGIFFE